MADTVKATSDSPACSGCGEAFGEKDDKRYGQCAKCRLGIPSQGSSPPLSVATGEIVPIRLNVGKESLPQQEPRDYYWCGVTPDCPFHYITLGGICFQKTMGVVTEVEPGREVLHDHAIKGTVHHLANSDIAKIVGHVKAKVIRNWREIEEDDGAGHRWKTYVGDLLSTIKHEHRRQYVRQPSDRSVGEFIFIVKVRHKEDRPMEDPPTVVART